MMLWTVATRNLGRNRRRSALTCGVVMFGFTAFALAAGFMAQSFEGLREGTIRGGTGHLQLADPATFARSEVEILEHGLAEAARVVALVRQDADVAEVLERIDFYGLITDGAHSVPFVGAGVDPEAEARCMDAAGLVTSGRWLRGREAREAVLGSGLASSLGVAPGQVVTLMAMTTDGVLNALDVDVVGVTRLPVRDLDDRYLATSLGAADVLLAAGGRVSKLVVFLRQGSSAEDVGERLRRTLSQQGIVVDFRTWRDLAVFYRQVRQLYLAIFGFLGLVLGIIVLLATANTMLMVTTERTREIGTLRALGARRSYVERLFLAESVLVAVVGCLAGAAFALVLRAVLNRSGIMLPPPPGVAHAIPLHIKFYPAAYVLGAAVMLLTVLAAAWLPARRAARREIVEALAHV